MTTQVQNTKLNKLAISPVFNFQKGDVIEFCDEYYFVVENQGSCGVVKPFGETFYVRFFQWQYQDSVAKFVRKPTEDELKLLGF